MIITAIIFILALITLSLFSLKSNGLTKRSVALDDTIANLITTLNRSVGQADSADETVLPSLTEAYNERAELDEEVADYNASMTTLSLMTSVIGVITVIATFL